MRRCVGDGTVQVDTFVVKGTDIGDVTRVIIGHDNSGPGPAWHCKQVRGGKLPAAACAGSPHDVTQAWVVGTCGAQHLLRAED